jgi:hypothetical protein
MFTVHGPAFVKISIVGALLAPYTVTELAARLLKWLSKLNITQRYHIRTTFSFSVSVIGIPLNISPYPQIGEDMYLNYSQGGFFNIISQNIPNFTSNI